VHGDVEFQGGLHLDGHIGGGVRSSGGAGCDPSVSEPARSRGVDVPNVMLQGTSRAISTPANGLVLGRTARVEGTFTYGVIEMTVGAQIKGKLVAPCAGGPRRPED